MMKRIVSFVTVTLFVSALALLTVGCAGHKGVTMPSVDKNGPSRLRGNGQVRFVSTSSPATIEVSDPDGLAMITVRDSANGRLYLFAGRNFPRGAKSVRIQLKNFGNVSYHFVVFIDMRWSVDSLWRINPDGTVTRIWP